MKVVVDARIPYARGFAERLGETVYIDGANICAADVRDADALVIRTRTRCNSCLLEGSSVRFVATATIGHDHIDKDFMKRAGISWTNCPGCNAKSVAQYVRNALLLLASHGCFTPSAPLTPPEAPATNSPYEELKKLTIGIVGVGHVGKEVLNEAKKLGFARILLCDPPRAEREGNAEAFATLDEVASECDVITFHTPLTRAEENAPYPTWHLADERFFEMLRPHAVVLNTSRGEVISTAALKRALTEGWLRAAVIDTWENEPLIDLDLLRMAYIATPHIAGYSADGKACGTRMALKAVAKFFGKDDYIYNKVCPPTLPADFVYFPQGCGWQVAEELRLYDPTRDSLALKTHPAAFEQLRGSYPLRREHA